MVPFRQERLVTRLMLIGVVVHVAACGGRPEAHAEKWTIRDEAVRVANGDVSLAGTLVLPDGPDGPRRHPAVVLFHGSGPQPRDLFTAHWFAKQGIAALAYDKRGVGESTGDFRNVPFMDLCGDGLAAIGYLKSRHDVDAKRIGVWGLSQGGWLGPLAASRSSDVAFVIAVSGPAVSPGEQMIFYYANELREQGVPESDVQEASALRRRIWNYLSTGNDHDAAEREMDAARTKAWYNAVKNQADGLFDPLPLPAEITAPNYRYARWFKKEMNYDPVPALRALHVPALFLYGSEDRLVNVDETVAVLRRVLRQSDNRDFTIQVFQHVTHDMHLTSGEKAGDIDPEYLEAMRTWLAAHLR